MIDTPQQVKEGPIQICLHLTPPHHFSQVSFRLSQFGPTDLAEMGLGVPPSAFNPVGVCFNNVTCFNIPVKGFECVLMFHRKVSVTLTIQVTVGAPPVAVDGKPWSYMALDNRQVGGWSANDH